MKGKRGRVIIPLIVLIVIFTLISLPLGPLPPLGRILNPGNGIWDPILPSLPQGLHTVNVALNTRHAEVYVYDQPDGFIGIASNQSWAVFYEQGFVQAEYRLAQMYVIKKEALGELSSVVGAGALSTDIFYRDLMNLQIAEREVSNISRTGFTYMAVSSFVEGINAYISTLSYGGLPLLFKVLNIFPGPWNITDVFAIQQLFLWQNSAGGSDPLYFNYALQKMPEKVVEALYPAYPAGIQNPIVPYELNPSIYSEEGNMHNLTLYTPSYNISLAALQPAQNLLSLSVANQVLPGSAASGRLLFSIGQGEAMDFSNDWAVNSMKTDHSASLLANDPHLTTSVPSIWMGFQLVFPGENAVGVTFPSFPGIILGHNPYLSWGATNGQIQQTYFYAETQNANNSYEYLSSGRWLHYSVMNESIQVKGSGARHIAVFYADNGVLLENEPAHIAMDWTGLSPTYEITFFLHIDMAATVNEFRQNLSAYFRTAIQNWAVADSKGNIGIFPYGDYPLVNSGNPRGILPGYGPFNWQGFIPFSQLPSLYDPARGFVFSANQITVSRNYPYYIGWDYEAGYRADEIYTLLNMGSGLNTSGMEEIQLNVHDFTTNVFLSPLIKALDQAGLSNTPEYTSLSDWNGDMNVNSTAASIYYFWLGNLLNETFMPYMEAYGINASEGLGTTSFFLGPDDTYHGPLIEDLVNWTVNSPNSSWFNNPLTGQVRNFSTLAVNAFRQTLSYLNDSYGSYSSRWDWGEIHRRYLSSLFGLQAYNTRSLPAAGDGNTINAAYGLLSDFGPSWRMVINMTRTRDAVGIYPGGISENPLSPYYDNTFAQWNGGVYFRLIPEAVPSFYLYLYVQGDYP